MHVISRNEDWETDGRSEMASFCPASASWVLDFSDFSLVPLNLFSPAFSLVIAAGG